MVEGHLIKNKVFLKDTKMKLYLCYNRSSDQTVVDTLTCWNNTNQSSERLKMIPIVLYWIVYSLVNLGIAVGVYESVFGFFLLESIDDR